MIGLAHSAVAILEYDGAEYEIWPVSRGVETTTNIVLSLDGEIVGVLSKDAGFPDVSDMIDTAFDYLNTV